MNTDAVLYECVTRHVRSKPFRYALSHRTYLWFVDLDRPPKPPWWLRPFAGFRAPDHLGGDGTSIARGVRDLVSAHGVVPPPRRVRMLAHARVFGHVFNPLTVYWCEDDDGKIACVVAEVHNTYGGRHAYVLTPDHRGRAETDKEFYVSPFFPVDGRYRMTLPPPGERLRIAVTLDRDDEAVFVASLSGRRRPLTTRTLLSAALRHPWSTLAVSLAIRWHGVKLYLRGLPVVPRGESDRKESTGCP